MEADFQQFYSLDLNALLDGGEFGRAARLAANLPAGSRTMRGIDPRLSWGAAEHLLALIADHLAFMRYEQGGGRGRRPKRVERPRAPEKARKPKRTALGMTKEQVRAILSAPRE